MIVVVMGVCGAGKSTVGRALAARLGCAFAEGDAFHPKENVAKMAAGEPLTDADRAPWLDALADHLDGWQTAGQNGVLACSALKRAYREVLAAPAPALRFLYLKGAPELLRARLAARRDHYMPPTLLDSQLATLEEPGLDENAIVLTIDGDPDGIVDAALTALQQSTEQQSTDTT